MPVLNGPQSRSILCGFLDIDRRMAELEALLARRADPSPFSAIENDLSVTEAKVVQDYFARIRDAMLAHLRDCEVALDISPRSLRWAIQCGISFMGITVDELRPSKLRGYGALGQDASVRSSKIHEDLTRLIDQVATYLRQGLGRDLPERLARLDRAWVEAGTLSLIEKVVSRHRLVEFQPAIEMIVSRLENPSFEIAVFGRVSCGKSSFLNHLAGTDALPVGVTPVTAVPTRLAYGDAPLVVVSFAESRSRSVGLEELGEYASEEGNCGNRKHVTGVLVKLPSPRLREGIVFVDTPGVGSLALGGAAETIAYLPRCDLGVVLIDSASAPNREDLALLRALYEAGSPAMVLLSKADLLSEGDRRRMIDYAGEQIRRELGAHLRVHPVSTVGALESLLGTWFETELTPLLDRHRSLVEASLKRKIAGLRQSVTAVLETLLAKQKRGRPDDAARAEATAAQRLLDGADEAIRRATELASNWWEGRRAMVESVPRLVAEAVVSAPGSEGKRDFAGVIEESLFRRGREAYDVVAALQDTLASTLEQLSIASPLAHADPSSIRAFHAGGLPGTDLEDLHREEPLRGPWWGGMFPSLAVQSTERMIREQLGHEIREAVDFYDRRVEAWLKEKLSRLVELYESQAGAFREQIRRLADRSDVAVPIPGAGDLEGDLRELRLAGERPSARPAESSAR